MRHQRRATVPPLTGCVKGATIAVTSALFCLLKRGILQDSYVLPSSPSLSAQDNVSC